MALLRGDLDSSLTFLSLLFFSSSAFFSVSVFFPIFSALDSSFPFFFSLSPASLAVFALP